MSKPSSSLYRIAFPDLKQRIQSAVDSGAASASSEPVVFFRADDIGIESLQFSKMIEGFKKFSIPLCLATVPSWLNRTRYAALLKITGESGGQWCWHQHGHVHRNYETQGKKQEFGPARDYQRIHESLAQGKCRLEAICGDTLHPVFTPPWNRCSSETLEALKDLGFKAVSRSKGAKPVATGISDFQVNADLHTRKEQYPQDGLNNLLSEIESSISSGCCGIMLHHQRMNRKSFELLETLLSCLKNNRKLSFVHFGDLLVKSPY